jgi:hypothetical protein
MEKTGEKEGIRAASTDRILSITKNQTSSMSNMENNILSEDDEEEEPKLFFTHSHTDPEPLISQPIRT